MVHAVIHHWATTRKGERMNIKPYVSVDSLQFAVSTKEDCVALYGEPKVIRKNREGATEFHYNEIILRFDTKDDTFRECTLLPYANATLNEIEVTWDHDFLNELCKADGAPRESFGFIVFGKLGIAVTGIHDNDESQLAITVFCKCDLDEFLRGSNTFSMN
jgi:hypothetical protein